VDAVKAPGTEPEPLGSELILTAGAGFGAGEGEGEVLVVNTQDAASRGGRCSNLRPTFESRTLAGFMVRVVGSSVEAEEAISYLLYHGPVPAIHMITKRLGRNTLVRICVTT
jgi:hypothetical protein